MNVLPKDIMQSMTFRMDIAEFYLAAVDDDSSSSSDDTENDRGPPTKRNCTTRPSIHKRMLGARHFPEYDTCKSTVHCKVKGCSGKTFIKCTTCKVHLCFTCYHNCFVDFHKFDC